MSKIQRCVCYPEPPSHVDRDGWIICNSCGGWLEGLY